MQVRNYSRKISIPATEIIEVLQSSFTKTNWNLTSELKDSHISLLDQTFGIDKSQPQLPQSKEQLQLPASESESAQIQTTLPTGELVEQLRENATKLTATDVEALQATVQTSIIEERAELAAIRDFQSYQTTYADTTRTLVVNDIYQKLDQRNLARKQFEQDQNELVAAQKANTEKSSDLMTEMLTILKADKYQSSFLTSKLEQI